MNKNIITQQNICDTVSQMETLHKLLSRDDIIELHKNGNVNDGISDDALLSKISLTVENDYNKNWRLVNQLQMYISHNNMNHVIDLAFSIPEHSDSNIKVILGNIVESLQTRNPFSGFPKDYKAYENFLKDLDGYIKYIDLLSTYKCVQV